MNYTILSKRQVDDTIFTEVEYVFDDNTSVIVDIPHFRPKSIEDIERGIYNRSFSEFRKIFPDPVLDTPVDVLDPVLDTPVDVLDTPVLDTPVEDTPVDLEAEAEMENQIKSDSAATCISLLTNIATDETKSI